MRKDYKNVISRKVEIWQGLYVSRTFKHFFTRIFVKLYLPHLIKIYYVFRYYDQYFKKFLLLKSLQSRVTLCVQTVYGKLDSLNKSFVWYGFTLYLCSFSCRKYEVIKKCRIYIYMVSALIDGAETIKTF